MRNNTNTVPSAAEFDRKLTLIAEATKRKGAGLTPKPGYSIPEQHREFLKAKKGTHGDYEPVIR